MIIAIADETITVNVQGWQKLISEPVHWRTWRTAEAAITALEDTPVGILIVNHDLHDVAGVASLVEYLEAEAGSEARSQIDQILIVAPTEAEAQPLINRLGHNTPYRVDWQPPVASLFLTGPWPALRAD